MIFEIQEYPQKTDEPRVKLYLKRDGNSVVIVGNENYLGVFYEDGSFTLFKGGFTECGIKINSY